MLPQPKVELKYSRCISTHNRCIIADCPSRYGLTHLFYVPLQTRKHFLHEFKHIPKKSSCCPEYLNEMSLRNLLVNPIHSFTADQLDDMIDLGFRKTFNIMENCDEDFFQNWVGLSQTQFEEFLVELPSLTIKKKSWPYCAILSSCTVVCPITK